MKVTTKVPEGYRVGVLRSEGRKIGKAEITALNRIYKKPDAVKSFAHSIVGAAFKRK
jgi:hypothetical protein